MPRYIDADALVKRLKHSPLFLGTNLQFKDGVIDLVERQPTADVAPRAEVAREIVDDAKDILLDYHLQEDKKYSRSLSKTKKQFEIETARYRAITGVIRFALETLNEIEDRYTEGGK